MKLDAQTIIGPIAQQVREQREALTSRKSETGNALAELSGPANVDIVLPVGYSDRLGIVDRSLRQITEELRAPEAGAKIRTVAAVLFDLSLEEREVVKALLRDLTQRGLIRDSIIVDEVRHSAARSVNSGMRALRDQRGFGEVILKLDDDARFATGALSKLVRGMKDNRLSVAAPLTIRPDKHVDYADDSAFANLEEQFAPCFNGDTVRAPSYVTPEGHIDLARLMMGRAMEYAPYPNPATPNENGLMVTRDLADQILTQPSKTFFSEAKGGSEGLRLWSALGASHHAERVGVVKVGIFDRCWGDPNQPISWGRSDVELLETLLTLNLIPQGVNYAGCTPDYRIYSGRIPNDSTFVVKGIDRLPWFINEIDRAPLTGLATLLPPAIAEHLPRLRDNLERLRQAVGADINELPHEFFGAVSADSPLLAQNQAILVNGILHLSGSSMHSEALGIPMRMFNFW